MASNFFWGGLWSDCLSDFLPSAMTLHKVQGCFPSNVRTTAWEKDAVERLATSMLVQATDCKSHQCSPMEQASTKAISSLGTLRYTNGLYGRVARCQIASNR